MGQTGARSMIAADVAVGLFETLRFERGLDGDRAGDPSGACAGMIVHHLGLHEERLARSWPAFFHGEPPPLEPLVAAALAATPLAAGLLKLAFQRDATGAPQIETSVRPLALPAGPVAVAVAAAPRRGPAAARCHKSLDRRWVAEATRAGFFETLVWSEEAGILEGTRTNLFLVRGGELLTPSVAGGLLAGVTRLLVLASAGRLGLRVREAVLARDDLERADGLLLTGRGVGVVAVATLDGIGLPAEPGSTLARDLAADVARASHS